MAKINKEDLITIVGFVAEGKLTPVIESRYKLSQVPEAVRYLGTSHARGKVIINVE